MPPGRMAADAKEGPLRIGGRFLKYTIQALLGTGGHAWVYQGHDPFLDVQVAIKILHRPGGVTKDMLRRGQAEAKLLYRLKHENIVNVLDAGITDEGLLYIVMELLEGETLRRLLLRKGRLALPDALPLFASIADGVEAAHAFKAVHRDLKPENIFVLDGQQPKVLDFGIAKVVDAAGWTTEKDVIHGTVLYMAPEQLHGEKATARADIYALGLIVFEALAGRHPLLLKNHRPTVKELTWMQLSLRPPRLDELDGRIPRQVARLVERMLLKVPEHRIATMAECANALRECIPQAGSAESGIRPLNAEPAPTFVTEPLRDTVRTEGVPFDATITVPRPRSPRAASNSTDPIETRSTVRPVTTGITHEPSRNTPFFAEDAQRRFMARVLAVSCVTGAALGCIYLVLTSGQPASPTPKTAAANTTLMTATPAVTESASAQRTAAPRPRATTAASPAPSALATVPPPQLALAPKPSVASAAPKVPRARRPADKPADDRLWVELGRENALPKPVASTSRLHTTTPILE
jgi:serine/threonine protein kinase